ncbi:MAG: hypothetical protein IKD31_02090 [Clostridia bacterium]|nr:hypothetical protein [Clostridia bacterium]
MHSKKLFSVCLALALACACLFGLCTLNAGAAATTWKVDGTQYATLQAAIDDAATKTWAAGDELVIEITATDAQTVKAVDGILFGAKTIFRADKTRLPITIKGGTLACDDSITGEIACANSYNFSNLSFDIGDKEAFFFAGSGEVALTVVNLGTAPKCHFYADNCTAKAFEGWTADHKAANTTEGFITTSMTFDGTAYNSNYSGVSNTSEYHSFGAYSSYVAAVGAQSEFAGASDAVKASDLRAHLIIMGGAALKDVSTRDVVAAAPVKEIVVTITGSDTAVETYFGMGGNVAQEDINGVTEGQDVASTVRETKGVEYPDCNFTINLTDGATITDRAFFTTACKVKGNININTKGGNIKSQSAMTHYATIVGNVNIVHDGTTFGASYWGCRSSEVTGKITHTVKGGTTFTRYYLNQSIKCNGDIENNLYDMTTNETSYLTGYSPNVSGNIVNNIYKGYNQTVKNVLATGHKKYPGTVNNITTNIYGGTLAQGFTALGGETTALGDVVLNVEFAADDTESIISGTVSGGYGPGGPSTANGNVTINLKKCHIGGDVNAYHGEGSVCKGNVTLTIDGAVIDGNVYGVNEATVEGNVSTTVKSGTIGGNFFGAGTKLGAGAAATVPGSIGGTVTTVIEGGTFKGNVFGGSEITGNLKAVSLEIKGGEFEKNVYATCGGAVTETSTGATADSAVLKISGGTFNGTVAANFTNGTYTTTVSGENSLTMEGTVNVKGFANLKPTAIPTGKTLTLNQIEVWNTTINYVEVAEALKASVKYTTANGVKGTVVEGTKDGIYTITGTETPVIPEPEPEPEPSTSTTVSTTTKKPTTTTKKPTTTTAAAGAVTTTAAAADDAGFPWVIVIVAAAVVVVAAVLLIVFRGKIFKKK